MKSIIKLLIQNFLALILLSSCAEGELFGEKSKPLPGKRMNVLHYDLLKNQSSTTDSISIPDQSDLTSWSSSDVGQFTGLDLNIRLEKDLKLSKRFLLPNFHSSSQDSAVLIIDNIVYSYAKAKLSAFNLSNNKKLWSVQALTGEDKKDVLNGSITYNNGVIYLSSGNRDFIAFSADEGKELWRFKAPNIIRHIALIHGQEIYISSNDNTLSCLSLDGQLLWRYDGTIYSLITSRLYAPYVVYEDKIVTISTAGDLVVLDRYDGSELTQVNLATTSIIGDGNLAKGPVASPVLIGHYVYILTGESDFIKIDLKDPQIVWRKNFAAAKSFWALGNVSYILTENNQLLSIDNLTGKAIWIVDLPNENKNKLSRFHGPILAGDNLIITSASGDFYLFSPKDGSLIKKHKNNQSTNQIPLILNNKAYFIGVNGNISIWK